MRIVKSTSDPRRGKSDIKGDYTTLYPISRTEVIQALQYAKDLGVKPLIKSGWNPAHDEKVEGDGRVVLQLCDLDDIEINNNKVTVGAGVTNAQLASRLIDHNGSVFLPLDTSPKRSVVSTILSARNKQQGFTGRSTGLLRDHVTSIECVTAKGVISTAASNCDLPDLEEAIVTKIECKTKTSNQVEGLVLSTTTFPYVKDGLRKLLDLLFIDEAAKTKGLDLVVQVHTAAFSVPVVSVTTSSVSGASVTDLMKKVEETYIHEPYGKTQASGGLQVLQQVAENYEEGIIWSDDHETRKQYTSEVLPSDSELKKRFDTHCHIVDKAFHAKNPSLRVTSSLQLQSDGKIGFYTSLYGEQHQVSDVIQDFASHHTSDAAATGAPLAPLETVIALAAAPNLVSSHAALNPSGIPDFKGEVFYKGDPNYKRFSIQYATSSYPDEAYRMSPSLIAFPQDTSDVIAIVRYAIKAQKKVVARSGGHQYCGMSSGGDDTIQVSMDLMNDARPLDDKTLAVGPGAKLSDLSKLLLKNQWSIPHGECPFVAIGGHVQTGGFGHTLRSFGLCLDYVLSFAIVLADDKGNVSSRKVTRPNSKVDPTNSSAGNLNDRLYWGVMGGGPGSFGILTDIEFECVRDQDHPNSVGFSGIYRYHRNTFKSCMKLAQEFTKGIEEGTLRADYDLMISCMNELKHYSRFFPTILVEILHGNLGGRNEAASPNVLDEYVDKIDPLERIVQFKGKKSLSSMVDEWVRRNGMLNGREFNLPYKKRVNATKRALTDAFVEDFVDLVNETIKDPNIKLVFQMVLGGGKYQSNGNLGITSIPHRDTVIGIVYDCFYKEGYEKRAEELQGKMQALLEKFQDYNEHDEKGIRMIWGSFGDYKKGELDMDNVWKNYYGEVGPYKQLQMLKRDVDPLDLFTNKFTVQMPQMPRGQKRSLESD